MGWRGATRDEAGRAKTPRKTPKYWQRPKRALLWQGGCWLLGKGRITMGPPSRRVPAAHGMLRPRSTPAAPHCWDPHNPWCGSGLAGGVLPLDHPFPAKPIPPLARGAPGTAVLPGNSCCRRARGVAAASAGRAGLGSSAAGAGWVPQGLGVQHRVVLSSVPLAGCSGWVTSCHPRRPGETRRCRMTDPGDIFMAGWKIPPLVGFFFPYFFSVLATSNGSKEGWERQGL